MTSHTPPEGAIEAGCGALWPGVSTTPARVAAVLTAAHEAGEILYPGDVTGCPVNANGKCRPDYHNAVCLDCGAPAGPVAAVKERDDAVARADEAVALLRTFDGLAAKDHLDMDGLLQLATDVTAFLATQEDRA